VYRCLCRCWSSQKIIQSSGAALATSVKCPTSGRICRHRRRRPPPYGLTDPSHSASSSRSNSRKTCTHILHPHLPYIYPHLPYPQSSVSTNVQKVEKLDIWQKLNTGVASAAPLDWIIFCHLHKHLYTRRPYHERRELTLSWTAWTESLEVFPQSTIRRNFHHFACGNDYQSIWMCTIGKNRYIPFRRMKPLDGATQLYIIQGISKINSTSRVLLF
jgi:hypothetical protein